MIICTNCGARNPDNATRCIACGRKLQSLWTLGVSGRGANSGGGSGEGWRRLEPLLGTQADARALRLVLRTLEVWAYAFLLLAGAFATVLTENWWYLACGVCLVAGVSWMRGI